mmetsp:Transcript_30589/g.66681  ORF Transcript_30589/g.66681 Transcript_30589/m.66681 type:complete len:446 (+) Transcript_30589:89-1426(+)
MAPSLALLALLLAVAVSSAEAVVTVRGLGTRGASAAHGAARSVARGGGNGRGGDGHGHREEVGDAQPTCSCDCCDVRNRRPDESLDLARVACKPSQGHSADMCGMQCTPGEEDNVLGSAAADNVLDYSRFCFFECKPAQGLESPPATQCLALTEDDVKLIMDKDGNAMDPSIVYGHNGRPVEDRPSASLLAKKQPSPEVQAVVDETTKGRKQAKKEQMDARKNAQEVRSFEEKRQRDLYDDLRGRVSSGTDPYAIVARLHESAARGKASAQRAAKAAQEANEAFKEAHLVNWQAGLDAAETAVKGMRTEAADAAYAAGHPPTPWSARAAAATMAAAKPYLDTVQAGEESAQQWDAMAASTESQASALMAQEQSLQAESSALAQSGQQEIAMFKFEQAKTVAKKAAEFETAAKKMRGSAEAARTSAKMWYMIAGAAGAGAGASVPR